MNRHARDWLVLLGAAALTAVYGDIAVRKARRINRRVW